MTLCWPASELLEWWRRQYVYEIAAQQRDAAHLKKPMLVPTRTVLLSEQASAFFFFFFMGGDPREPQTPP